MCYCWLVIYVPTSRRIHRCESYATRGIFYVRRAVELLKPAKVNTYIIHMYIYLERLSFYLYIQPKTISKCIAPKRQRRHWKYDRNMTMVDSQGGGGGTLIF